MNYFKNYLSLSLFLLWTLSSYAQQNTSTIQGKVMNPQEGKSIFLVKMDLNEGDHSVVDTLELDEENRFNAEINDPDPNIYLVSFYRTQIALLALEPGQSLNIEADGSDANGSLSLSGSPGSEALLKFTNTRSELEESRLKPLVDEYQTAREAEDQEKMEAIVSKYEKAQKEIQKELYTYVMDNMSNSFAAYATFMDWDDQESMNFMKKLSEKIESTQPGLALTKGINAKIKRLGRLAIGATAPEIKQMTPEGKEVSLADFRGKYLLIDFWAAWCGPCRQENPNVVKVYNKYKDQGFDILGVSLDQSKDKWVEAIAKDQLTWTQVSDLGGWGSAPAATYQVRSIPANFLLDKEGRIIAKNLRGAELEAKIAEIFAAEDGK